MIDGFTRNELLAMVAKQMATIHMQREAVEQALNAFNNGAPDLGWNKLLELQQTFNEQL